MSECINCCKLLWIKRRPLNTLNVNVVPVRVTGYLGPFLTVHLTLVHGVVQGVVRDEAGLLFLRNVFPRDHGVVASNGGYVYAGTLNWG